jgi:hypothetical protein
VSSTRVDQHKATCFLAKRIRECSLTDACGVPRFTLAATYPGLVCPCRYYATELIHQLVRRFQEGLVPVASKYTPLERGSGQRVEGIYF